MDRPLAPTLSPILYLSVNPSSSSSCNKESGEADAGAWIKQESDRTAFAINTHSQHYLFQFISKACNGSPFVASDDL